MFKIFKNLFKRKDKVEASSEKQDLKQVEELQIPDFILPHPQNFDKYQLAETPLVFNPNGEDTFSPAFEQFILENPKAIRSDANPQDAQNLLVIFSTPENFRSLDLDLQWVSLRDLSQAFISYQLATSSKEVVSNSIVLNLQQGLEDNFPSTYRLGRADNLALSDAVLFSFFSAHFYNQYLDKIDNLLHPSMSVSDYFQNLDFNQEIRDFLIKNNVDEKDFVKQLQAASQNVKQFFGTLAELTTFTHPSTGKRVDLKFTFFEILVVMNLFRKVNCIPLNYFEVFEAFIKSQQIDGKNLRKILTQIKNDIVAGGDQVTDFYLTLDLIRIFHDKLTQRNTEKSFLEDTDYKCQERLASITASILNIRFNNSNKPLEVKYKDLAMMQKCAYVYDQDVDFKQLIAYIKRKDL